MRKIGLFLLLACFCLLLGCSAPAPDDSQSPPVNDDSTNASLEKPEEMKDLSEDSRTTWMAGMNTTLEDAEMIGDLSTQRYIAYTDPGDVIKANVIMQNGLNKSQRFELMVFADGIPVKFKVNGEQYNSYPVDLTPGLKIIPIEFDKDFALNLGRLDFVMSYTENLQGSFHLGSQTLRIDIDGESLVPTALCATVAQREIFQEKYTGKAYDAWIWNEGVTPTDTDAAGPRKLSLRDGETVLLEAIATKPGLYRTVLVVGETPVEFEINGTKYLYLDWESTGTNMIQLPIKLEDAPPSGSIYTVTTPLNTDAMAQPIAASRRIELTANGEE